MSSDEQTIRDVLSTWLIAPRDGDIGTVLSPDAVCLMQGRPPMSKAGFAVAACARSGANAPRIDGTDDIDEIRIVGDWALLVSRLTVTVTSSEGGRPQRRAGHASSALT